jgi:hypothetical protein|tara:strand:- start:467 stop:670 length:204 start_codon:yes stop_codon:yes gene_type:complete
MYANMPNPNSPLEQFKARVKELTKETKRGETVFDLHFLHKVVTEIEQLGVNEPIEQIVTGGTFKDND